ncbi:hypothetical protein [Paracoccus albus]|uniref:hypothetical protein n=1 Tax=Paracoccus albus TaxID=3017784 RepID=UPI0022F01F11|nr:hypothetical protein [Paracoccus albus]WBU61457.1 hypothetical protein PAF20_06035 [Paracoccus albus]
MAEDIFPDKRPPIRALGDAPPVSNDWRVPDLVERATNYGNQVAVMPHMPKELLRFLHLKLYESARMRKRARWPGGGFLNWALGEGEPDYIHCAGSHLRQILEVLSVEPPANIERMAQYALSVGWAQQAYDRLCDEMGVKKTRF